MINKEIWARIHLTKKDLKETKNEESILKNPIPHNYFKVPIFLLKR